MIIKLTQINDAKLGTKAAKEIVGTKVEDGKEWRKKFFASDKTLRDQLDDVDVGDTINVILKQEGDFWNIKEIRMADDADLARAKGPRPSGGQGQQVRRADGGSRGDDTNRSAAIYLAREIVNMKFQSDGGYGTLTVQEIACICADLADNFIYPYIKDGAVPVVKHTKPRMKKVDDPLEPPDVD